MSDRELEIVEANGIRLRVATAGRGPLCVLIHGWPELWLSWRHQLQDLAAAGFRVAAPDLRGYGGSSRPESVDDYRMTTMAADLEGLIRALGETEAVLIGHDWGAPIAWNTALLHPERVRAVAGLSVPYLGRGPRPPTELLQAFYQDRFFYILYFQQPGVAEAELEADVADSLRKIFYSVSGDVSRPVRQAMRARRKGSGYLEGMAAPTPFPPWLSEDDLGYYVRAFASTGFGGSLNRYRNLDRDWHELEHLDGARIAQPALFVAGEYDSVLRYLPGIDLLSVMDAFFDDLRAKVIVPNAGHWVQQERPGEVSAAFVDFLRGLP